MIKVNVILMVFIERKATYWRSLHLDGTKVCSYNVITMKASIVKIGNSRGIRIPKIMLEESGIDTEVEIKVTRGGIKISPTKKYHSMSETLAMSQHVLAREWDTPEEDAAWANL